MNGKIVSLALFAVTCLLFVANLTLYTNTKVMYQSVESGKILSADTKLGNYNESAHQAYSEAQILLVQSSQAIDEVNILKAWYLTEKASNQLHIARLEIFKSSDILLDDLTQNQIKSAETEIAWANLYNTFRIFKNQRSTQLLKRADETLDAARSNSSIRNAYQSELLARMARTEYP